MRLWISVGRTERSEFRQFADVPERRFAWSGLRDYAIGCGAAVDGSPGREPREAGKRFREAAEQRRKADVESTSLLRSSGVLWANDLRFYRRLPHATAPQRIAGRPPFDGYTRIVFGRLVDRRLQCLPIKCFGCRTRPLNRFFSE